MVICDADCGGAEYARDNGIPVIVFPQRKDTQEVFSAEELVIALRLDLYFVKSNYLMCIDPSELFLRHSFGYCTKAAKCLCYQCF